MSLILSNSAQGSTTLLQKEVTRMKYEKNIQKKIIKTVFILVFVLVIVTLLYSCKSKSEKLEENLISKKWNVVTYSGASGTMQFYKNNTAIFNGDLISNGYEWSIKEKQLTLIYDDDTFIYDVTEDNSNGYIFSLVGGDYAPVYRSYKELKLTPID